MARSRPSRVVKRASDRHGNRTARRCGELTSQPGGRVDSVSNESGPHPRNRHIRQTGLEAFRERADGQSNQQPIAPVLETVDQPRRHPGMVESCHPSDPAGQDTIRSGPQIGETLPTQRHRRKAMTPLTEHSPNVRRPLADWNLFGCPPACNSPSACGGSGAGPSGPATRVGRSHQRHSISQPEATSPSYLQPPFRRLQGPSSRKREDSRRSPVPSVNGGRDESRSTPRCLLASRSGSPFGPG
jgi:hypothetical protein